MYPFWSSPNRPPYGSSPWTYQTPTSGQSGNDSTSSTTQQSSSSPSTQQQTYTSPFQQAYNNPNPYIRPYPYQQSLPAGTYANPYSTPSYPSNLTSGSGYGSTNPYSSGTTSSTVYGQLPSSPTPASIHPPSSSMVPYSYATPKIGIAPREHGQDTLLNRFPEENKGPWCCENCKRERAKKYERPMDCFHCQEETDTIKMEG
ncbi:hypothetical protein I302_108615 [Kwoniella bestiolae CBS 10118]|uniref:Uncharacterized protein n=1 Tax=Kwoniella bestiolae CBS 10118 TaxID=1296100 RepID=A0A1B9FTM0_9TREE|nr:hypothetical protein I302_07753 [Kwoniella bestiolae CBS 10118]OCF22111.1 hypothetical protein I302_07753 [Kwoniella bestiolae CBS 10118]